MCKSVQCVYMCNVRTCVYTCTKLTGSQAVCPGQFYSQVRIASYSDKCVVGVRMVSVWPIAMVLSGSVMYNNNPMNLRGQNCPS